LPDFWSGALRARLYRAIGFPIGKRCFFMGNIEVVGQGADVYSRLTVGDDVHISTHVTISLDAPVTIEDNVTIGPFVRIYTGTHELGSSDRRCSPAMTGKAVLIERGSWIAVGATVLPGVRIGRGSVISAGAVVGTDIPPNSYAAGVPARSMRSLPDGDD
jgi:acetyltransferase-like isoleucine patch superfamily enzyme